MKNFLIILWAVVLSLVILAIFWIAMRFIVGGPEDDWICTNEGWVKHGEPSAPMPIEQCGLEIDCTSFNLEECPSECVVCPPCPECSSTSCQTAEFCSEMGIDKSWYENIQKQIKNFNDCAAAGNAIMESYPRQCRSGDQIFTEDIGNELEKMDLIRVNTPRPNQVVSSPLTVGGEARGNWFFEGDFPIVLVNWDGLIIAEGYATAKTDFMTEEFVKFTAELEFTKPELYNNGILILHKDNPSGLVENDDELRVPVEF